MQSQIHICPLCQSNGEEFYNQQFQKCSRCQSIFRCPEFFISATKEQARYKEHNNDINDERYQEFVSPIVEKIITNHLPAEKGLDFGAGTGPVISYLLEKKGFNPKLYDPFFHDYPDLLEKKYDFIIACEVVEHFFNPKKEFDLLYSLLEPNGKLYIMTNLYSEKVDFNNWYYKNDKTHVFFYTIGAFKYIKNYWKWTHCERQGRCIILEK